MSGSMAEENKKLLIKTINKEKYTAKIFSKEDCVTEIECEISPDYYIEMQNNELKALSKEVTVPGFRKGKAPGSIVQQKFLQTLSKRTDDTIANQCFNEIASEHKFQFINPQPKVQFTRRTNDKKILFISLFFEERPYINDIDLDQIKIDPPKKSELTKKEIDQTINQIKLLHATWKDTNGPVFENELCSVDLSMTDKDGKKKTVLSNEVIPIVPHLVKNNIPEWLTDGIKGMKVGETKTVTPPNPDGASTITATIKLLRIQGAVLPEENLEFFEKLGVKSASQFRSMIKKLLEERTQEKNNLEVTKAFTAAIYKQEPFALPLSMVHAELQSRVHEIMKNEAGKKTMEAGLQHKEFVEGLRSTVVNFLRDFFVLMKIHEQFKIPLKPPKRTKNALTDTLELVQGEKQNTKDPNAQYYLNLLYSVSTFVANKHEKKQ